MRHVADDVWVMFTTTNEGGTTMARTTHDFRNDVGAYTVDPDDVDVFDYIDATVIIHGVVCPEIVDNNDNVNAWEGFEIGGDVDDATIRRVYFDFACRPNATTPGVVRMTADELGITTSRVFGAFGPTHFDA